MTSCSGTAHRPVPEAQSSGAVGGLRPHPMTPADVDHLCRWYRHGATIEGIIEVTPFSFRAVRTTLIDAGVTVRPQMIQVPPCPPGMVSAYKHGESIRQLAARFGHSYNQTRNMLLHAGVELRPRGAAPRRSPRA